MKRDLVLAHNFVQSSKKSTCQKADDTGVSSSSTTFAESDNYDVFLSFSSKDTRKTFADHLYNSLVDAGIRVFRDNNELHEGGKISTNLLQAIKNSKISIPILSRNYASSKWCVQELVQMIECTKSDGHIVMPIFYRVEPAHVQYQVESFGKTFSHLSRKFLEEDVAKWKQALQEVASLKGWESERTANGHEGELIKMVIIRVLSELKKAFQLVVPEQLVGIDNAVENILRLLDDNPNATQIVGIYGMGGIGKTTLAKVGISCLQNQLISDILRMNNQASNMGEGIRIMESRFKCKKVLLLLDDVDRNDQLKALVRKHDWFEMGSRIIITTRMRSVLDEAKVRCTYELKEIAKDESLILFSRHAFLRDSPPCEFESLSRAVVSTTGGLPLALECTYPGSFLCGRNRAFWEDTLKKLKEVPIMKVQEKLRISYEALNYEEKQIFLDIACFFVGANFTFASYMWDACNFLPRMGIQILSFMSLIKIGDEGELKMHDQLRNLGREIVRQEDYVAPMNRSRLRIHEEALEVLQNTKGVEKVRVQALLLSGDCSQVAFTTEQFETLPNLRLLAVHNAKLMGDSKSLLPKLRWLSWTGCPAFVPTSFGMEKLVVLDLSRSNILDLWEGWSHLKVAKELKVLDLTYCCCLKITLDLSTFRNLEILILNGCINLEQIHLSIGEAKSLTFLYLQDCEKLQELPEEMGKLEELKGLHIGKTKIKEIPPCIGSLKKLEVLNASGCRLLARLPDSIRHLVNLLILDLRDCFKLCRLPESIGSFVKLRPLSLCGSLECLNIFSFLGVNGFSELDAPLLNDDLVQVLGLDKLKNLEKLRVWDCQSLVRPDLSKLTHLKRLSIRRCGNLVKIKGLERLKNLEKLNIKGCISIERLPELSCFSNLKDLDIRGCSELCDVQGLEKVANVRI
ncbi:hypothetical protein ACJRO7_018863 [Eucalyptus globulus]|uniref:TIR domain-containing protein n=1 Tax=Eucalyptus globulus TaxID=34317 RepID=A0ABD3L1F4_EUCGL